MPSFSIKLAIIFAAAVLLSGCTLSPSGQTSSKADGGIWRSSDSGATVTQINDVLATRGKVVSLSNAGIVSLAFDPQDPATIYAASAENGIFFTVDGGNSWQQFKQLKQGRISGIAVDHRDKCVVFAISGNKLFKTENCGRDWNDIYFHQKSQVSLSSLAVDPKASPVVYLGTSEGEILKSTDGGHSWLTVFRLDSEKIVDILIDPSDSKIIYLGTSKKGLYKSANAGISWNSLGAGLQSYAGSHEYRKLIFDPATANSLILISRFGLLRTTDGGDTWKIIELLPAHKTVNILAAGVNPENSNEFYYVTASTLVKTVDAGIKWSSKQLPYGRLTTDMKVNPDNPAIIYLATQAVK